MSALANIGLITAWAAIVVRGALSATRTERQLLAAVAVSLAQTTLYVPHISDLLNNLVGHTAADLTRHTAAIVAAAIMVSFALAPTRPRWIKWWIVAGGLVLAALMGMRDPAGFTQSFTGTGEKSAVGGAWPIIYFMTLGGYCIATLTMTIVAFLTAARSIPNRFTTICLRLICVNLALVVMTWTLNYIWLITHDLTWIEYIQLLDVISPLFLAAALLISLGGPLTSRVQMVATYRRIHPLWAALTSAVPEVVLEEGRSRFRHHGIQRLAIELRDCILILGDFIEPADIEEARQRVDAVPDPDGDRDMTMTAICLQRAREKKLAGNPHGPDHLQLLQSSSSAILEDDVAELIRVADAYRLLGVK